MEPVESAPLNSRLWLLAAGGAASSLVITVSALFPDFWAGEPSLSSDSRNLAFNIPYIAVSALTALLLLVPRLRPAGLGAVVGGALLAAPAYIEDLSRLDGKDAGAGFVLGQLGFVVFLLSAAIGLVAARGAGLMRMKFGASTARWAALGAGLGVVYGIGDAMNWLRVNYHATAAGYTYQRTGTAFLHVDCCTLLDHHGWSLWTEVVRLGLGVVLPVLAAILLRTRVGLSALAATGFLLCAAPLSGVVGLAQTITPDRLGIGYETVTTSGLQLTQQGLPGLWIAFGAALALLALAGLRGLTSASRTAHD